MSILAPDIYIDASIQAHLSPLPPEAAEWPSVQEYLEDLGLRRRAKDLHPLITTVTTTVEDHPAQPCVCESCGASFLVLSSCGAPLCLPCWRKSALRSYQEIAPAVLEAIRRRQRANMRAGVRFVGLTCRHHQGEPLATAALRILGHWQTLRDRRFWRDRVDGSILKVEVTKGVQGWHVHLHLITVGRFMPKSPMFAREDETDLLTEWREITGDSSVVYITEPAGDGTELVRELAKYVAKPTADDGDGHVLQLADWPHDDRKELATLLAGGRRVRWYCPAHRARSRWICRDYRAPYGMVAIRCQGEYRREHTGFRRLRWYGELKLLRGILLTEEHKNDEAPNCPRCGDGRLRNERWWRERYEAGHPNAQCALDLIQAHKSGDKDAVLARHPGDPMATMPSGWIPPPLKGVEDQDAAADILTIMAEGERDLWQLIDMFREEDHGRLHEAATQLSRAGYLSVHGETLLLTAAGRRRSRT